MPSNSLIKLNYVMVVTHNSHEVKLKKSPEIQIKYLSSNQYQGCENSMPDLSHLVSIHSGLVSEKVILTCKSQRQE